jgi:hypothetical protein
MIFEVIYMTTEIVPPLEEPEGEVCSVDVTVKVK